MAESVTYSKIVELLDNSQYLAALKKAEDEEKTLTALRTAGGTAAVKALRETERAQQQQAKEAARAAAEEMAAQQKKAAYLERLRIQSYKDEQKAAERAERDAQKAAAGPSAWTLALQANTKALADQGATINKAREATGLLGAAVGAVSPQLATMIGGLQKAEGVLSATAAGAQVLGSSLVTVGAVAAPVVAVAGTLAYAWEQAEERQAAATAQTEAYTSALGQLGDAMAVLARQQVELDERAGLLTGEYSAQEVAFDKARRSAADATKAQREATEEQLAALIAEGNVIKYNQENWSKTGLLFRASAKELSDAATTNAARVAELERQLKALDETVTDVAETTVTVTTAEEKHKDAIEASAQASRNAAEAVRERERDEAALLKVLLAEADAESKRAATVEKARGSLDGLRRSSELALATDEERIQLAAQASREAAVAAANEAQAAANSSAEKKRIYQDLSATIININVDEQRQLQAIEEAKTATAKAEADKRAEEEAAAAKRTVAEISNAYSMTSDALGDYFDSVLDASTDKIGELEEAIEKATENGNTSRAESLKKQLAAEKEAATKAFEWQQTLSAANATVNWLEALVKATTYGPVGGPLVAGAATLAYGLSLKQIESQQPTFSDTPAGGYRMGPEGQTVRGAANDTAILFRDPLEGFAQAVEVMARRQAPTSSPKRGGRSLLGVSAATTPVSRLLTRDVERATRGKL